ncbi:protease modulator HflC [Acidisoma cellulosilytica]|uniref:Protease modulator HflC n=1 Tax=Acidisoma cellulosilyticum TaxID=2802395 RepID=A0A964E676_9PROT|nr:protease modulator HflC [Acidisoma cellulosilyticum]MCB8883217.1 protease modulator HflC [Acidisoma cellulosilyticum]
MNTAALTGTATAGPKRSGARLAIRLAFAGIILAGAAVVSSDVMVTDGEAVVVTRFGDPVRVLTRPGLAWKIPAPIDSTIKVDLRLHTTSSGVQDVGTRDGLRILVQAFLAWRVPSDPARIQQFLRATGNNPDEAARQLRSFVGSALQITASDFDLDDLVNTDPTKVRLAAFEQQLQDTIAQQVLAIYGVQIEQVGVERLSLPAETLAATVARMRSERETVAAERTAEGLRIAAQIRSDAMRDARITIANAQADAAAIEAQSREKAAEIYGATYARDPSLYLMLRSLDTLTAIVGPRTRLILRTDAAPFNVLVQGPPQGGAPQGGPPQGNSPTIDRPAPAAPPPSAPDAANDPAVATPAPSTLAATASELGLFGRSEGQVAR